MFKMKWLMEQEGNQGSGDWRAALPDALKSDPTLAKYKSVEELARGHVETTSFVGKSIRPLGQNATPEEKRQYVEKLLAADPALIYAPDGDEEATRRLFKKLGRPDKPEEYKFDEDAVTAAGLKPADLRSLAVTAELTQKQAERLAKVMVDANLEVKRQSSLEQRALDEKWGAAKEERILAAKAAAMKMGLNEQEIAALPPRLLESYYNVGKAVGVNTNEFRQHGHAPPPLTPDEITAEEARIRAEPAYWDKYKDPVKNDQLVKRMRELGAMRR